jgi:hypothetical protein
MASSARQIVAGPGSSRCGVLPYNQTTPEINKRRLCDFAQDSLRILLFVEANKVTGMGCCIDFFLFSHQSLTPVKLNLD